MRVENIRFNKKNNEFEILFFIQACKKNYDVTEIASMTRPRAEFFKNVLVQKYFQSFAKHCNTNNFYGFGYQRRLSRCLYGRIIYNHSSLNNATF